MPINFNSFAVLGQQWGACMSPRTADSAPSAGGGGPSALVNVGQQHSGGLPLYQADGRLREQAVVALAEAASIAPELVPHSRHKRFIPVVPEVMEVVNEVVAAAELSAAAAAIGNGEVIGFAAIRTNATARMRTVAEAAGFEFDSAAMTPAAADSIEQQLTHAIRKTAIREAVASATDSAGQAGLQVGTQHGQRMGALIGAEVGEASGMKAGVAAAMRSAPQISDGFATAGTRVASAAGAQAGRQAGQEVGAAIGGQRAGALGYRRSREAGAVAGELTGATVASRLAARMADVNPAFYVANGQLVRSQMRIAKAAAVQAGRLAGEKVGAIVGREIGQSVTGLAREAVRVAASRAGHDAGREAGALAGVDGNAGTASQS